MQNEKKEMYKELPELYRQLVDKWDKHFLMRSEVPEFTMGLLSSQRLADLHTLNQGPPHQKVSNKAVYNPVDFAYWMYQRDAG
jgi:hypothetical protein